MVPKRSFVKKSPISILKAPKKEMRLCSVFETGESLNECVIFEN